MRQPHDDVVASGEAVFAIGHGLRVASWNRAMEELTGIRAPDALGQPCWTVLRGHGVQGALRCHRECSLARNARAGFSVPAQDLVIGTTAGPRRVSMSTIVVRDRPEPLIVHLLRETSTSAVSEQAPRARLTPRQLQVLRLLADGVPARGIAERLGIAETTARNHIRAVLSELGAHSQLDAVARARAQGLV
jgi:DNA-binding CsgD family transcriptional regulator